MLLEAIDTLPMAKTLAASIGIPLGLMYNSDEPLPSTIVGNKLCILPLDDTFPVNRAVQGLPCLQRILLRPSQLSAPMAGEGWTQLASWLGGAGRGF